nr:immunoglobulin light chain junction region [Macaca mulatta]MOV75601.1 immunoglobulin light chain junction region [Macaca mulatta]MOV75622.1 immunoglobulin light chain junction region [Macaca mulatta]MOV75809.1 immunoglobulin light chain junction region [Macaca mulatta]MOV76077.1 immunoglobulin light chain junction region [Macaca mulatta]
CQQYNTDPYSF